MISPWVGWVHGPVWGVPSTASEVRNTPSALASSKSDAKALIDALNATGTVSGSGHTALLDGRSLDLPGLHPGIIGVGVQLGAQVVELRGGSIEEHRPCNGIGTNELYSAALVVKLLGHQYASSSWADGDDLASR